MSTTFPDMQSSTSHLASSVQDTTNRSNVSASATFYPNANVMALPADAVLVSSDGVFFYVNSVLLLSSSDNAFASTPSMSGCTSTEDNPLVLPVSEHSHVLNVILLTIYGMSAAAFQPSVDTLSSAVDGLVKYGIPLQTYVASGTPLFVLLLACALRSPLDIYTLAAQYDLNSLAVETSPFLLAHSVQNISAEYAKRMGPVYLKRLLALQDHRQDVLKQILKAPPRGHPETLDCKAEDQAGLSQAWELTAAYLIWEQRPGMYVYTQRDTFDG